MPSFGSALLLDRYHAKNSFNDPRTCATARTCSHIFVEARSHFKLPPFPCVTICMLFAYPATINEQYFNFVIGSRTSTCVLDLWFTYIHYISNGFLIFSTGSQSRPCRVTSYKRCTCITVRCIMSLYVNPL